MRGIAVLLLAFMATPVCAGDLWEVVSTSTGPDGAPIANTQTKCIPGNEVDAARMLDGQGRCTFDQKSGNDSAMTFTMTCRMQDMPPDLESMKVSGDAKFNGDKFDMRYVIMVGGNQSLPGGDFKMTGSLEARKTGPCNER